MRAMGGDYGAKAIRVDGAGKPKCPRGQRCSCQCVVIVFFFFFFFWCSYLMGRHMHKQSAVHHISLGRRGSHPTSGEHQGKCFMHAPAYAGQCGTGSSRGARWPHLCHPGSLPTKTPGCLHQSRWRSSSFVEHFFHMLYTTFVFKALFSYK